MNIKYFCGSWGLDHLSIEMMLGKIKGAGFDGVEMGIPTDPHAQRQLRDQLKRFDLELIAHQYQAQGDFEEYLHSFRASLLRAAGFNPLFINSHSGRDYWSFEQNKMVCETGFDVERQTGIKIFHETHRKHFLFSTLTAEQFFDHFPELKITADFSHWTCVSESMLDDQPKILAKAIERTGHIHARVGHEQGPQIPDPRAPEWEPYVNTFVNWWQQVADTFRKNHREYLTITPEFGPVPYTWKLPYIQQPVSDFFEINCFMKKYLQENLIVDQQSHSRDKVDVGSAAIAKRPNALRHS
jgi:sugar phosphate isomerase/epimerase